MDDARVRVERLVKACKTVTRQWEGGHPPGHDAIVELHRALKVSVPGLVRPTLELVTATSLADLLESVLTDQDHPLHKRLWEELLKRGWDVEQTLPGVLGSRSAADVKA